MRVLLISIISYTRIGPPYGRELMDQVLEYVCVNFIHYKINKLIGFGQKKMKY